MSETFIAYRTRVFIPYGLIERAQDEQWLKVLEKFIVFKSLFKNNTIYGHNCRKLAKYSGYSVGTVSMYLKMMMERGLAWKSGANLSFAGAERLKSLCNGKKALTNVTVDRKNQFDILRGKIVQRYLNQQQYRIAKSDTISGNNFLLRSLEKISAHVHLSSKGLGDILNRKQTTGKRIRKKLSCLGIIKVDRVINLLFRGVTREFFLINRSLLAIPAHAKYINGNVVVDKASRIEYLDTRFPGYIP